MKKKQWIGVVGRNGSGKSAICSYLEKKGFGCVSLSKILRGLLQETGAICNREALIAFGTALKAKEGASVLARKALDSVNSDTNCVVFDSIRLPEEVLLLKNQGVFILGTKASLESRYQRIKSRANDTDHISFEIFKRQDEHEFLGKSSGQHLQKCLELCDIILNNDSTLQELYDNLDQILDDL